MNYLMTCKAGTCPEAFFQIIVMFCCWLSSYGTIFPVPGYRHIGVFFELLGRLLCLVHQQVVGIYGRFAV